MLVFGLLMPIFVTIVKPKEDIKPFLSMIEDADDGDIRKSLIGTVRVNFLLTKDDVGKDKGWFHRKWREFDNKYIKPYLIDKEKLEEQRKIKEELEAKVLGDDYGNEVEVSRIEEKKTENTVIEESKSYENTEEKKTYERKE